MFSLESPHLDNSYVYTQYTIFNIKKEKSSEIFPNLQLLDFSKGLKDVFEIAMGNELSVFQPLKFYCI